MDTQQKIAQKLIELKNACLFCNKWLVFNINSHKLEKLANNQNSDFNKDLNDASNDFLRALLAYKERTENSISEYTAEESTLENFLENQSIFSDSNTIEDLAITLASNEKTQSLINYIDQLFIQTLDINNSNIICISINSSESKSTSANFEAVYNNNPLERAISFLSIVAPKKTVPFYVKVDEEANAVAITFEEDKLTDLTDSEIKRYALDLVQKASQYKLINRKDKAKILCSDIRLMTYLIIFLQTSQLITPQIFLTNKNCEFISFSTLNYLINSLRNTELKKIAKLFDTNFLPYGNKLCDFYHNLYNDPQKNLRGKLAKNQANKFLKYLLGADLSSLITQDRIEHIPIDQLILLSAGKNNMQQYIDDLKNSDSVAVDKYFSEVTKHIRFLSEDERRDVSATLSHSQINNAYITYNESADIKNGSANHQKGIELQQKLRQ